MLPSSSVAGRDGIDLPHLPALVGQSAFATPERHLHSEKHTFFFVQLSLAVLCWNVVRKEMCIGVSSQITPTPLLCETTKRDDEWVVEHRTHEKHSDCSSFWQLESYQTSSIMSETNSARCVNSRVRQWYSLSWKLDSTCVTLCTTVRKM